jgi:hypothetical protein
MNDYTKNEKFHKESRKFVVQNHISQDLTFKFNRKEFEKIADDVSLACDAEDLINSLVKATVYAELRYFALFAMRAGSRSLLGPRLFTNWPQEWLQHYCKNNYQFVDPFLEKARRYDGVFYLEDVADESPIVKSYMSDAERYRLGMQGVCFALSKSDGTRVAVQFSPDSQIGPSEKRVSEVEKDLQVISDLAADAFCYICQPHLLTHNSLTLRELQFLFALATNDNPEIARHYNAVYGGNKALQSSIKKKLNVTSIFQAVSISVAAGWFDDLPIRHEEVIRSNSGLLGWELLQE